MASGKKLYRGGGPEEEEEQGGGCPGRQEGWGRQGDGPAEVVQGGGPGWEGWERSPTGWLIGRRPRDGRWGGEALGRPRLGRATGTLPGDRQQHTALPVLCRCRAVPGGTPWVQAAGRGASRVPTP